MAHLRVRTGILRDGEEVRGRAVDRRTAHVKFLEPLGRQRVAERKGFQLQIGSVVDVEIGQEVDAAVVKAHRTLGVDFVQCGAVEHGHAAVGQRIHGHVSHVFLVDKVVAVREGKLCQSRQVILLALDGKNNQETATLLGVSVNTVKTLKKGAYAKLRTLLAPLSDEEIFMLLALLAASCLNPS
ncbi:MAG TPA: hypothetical protein DCZ73_01400 [Bacteroides sp.]|nr:hypothetical protein [Phocaeicola coprophilus]HBB06392.1 hypothetical protein [Bacteroides sp.]